MVCPPRPRPARTHPVPRHLRPPLRRHHLGPRLPPQERAPQQAPRRHLLPHDALRHPRESPASPPIQALISPQHLAVDLQRIIEGFITERDGPGGPIGYFGKLFEWSHVFKTAIFALQTVLADSFAVSLRPRSPFSSSSLPPDVSVLRRLEPCLGHHLPRLVRPGDHGCASPCISAPSLLIAAQSPVSASCTSAPSSPRARTSSRPPSPAGSPPSSPSRSPPTSAAHVCPAPPPLPPP